MKKEMLNAVKVYNGQEKLEDLILNIVEKELEDKFNELYNQTQADIVIHDEERWVA